MNPAYLLTKPDGSTVLLFSATRARGLAAHFGWALVALTAEQGRQHILAALKP